MTASCPAGSGAVLYTPDILALAVSLAEFPLRDDLPWRGEASSRVCGSKLAIALSTDPDGAIAESGARVSACAIGQAAAALFLQAAAGRDEAQLSAATHALEIWLSGDAPPPPWPGIESLAPARGYPARHAAILLPWKAALAALSNARAAA